MKRKPRAYWIGEDDDDGQSMTASEIIEGDEDTDTGLIDQHGNPIRRPSRRIKFGFHIR
jgi:hypothetical protein